MPQLKEIFEKERDRNAADKLAVVHLFREGTFYRAYEWSAWLMVRHFTEMKVTHRVMKGGDDVVFVGFPLTSLDRYTAEGAEVRPDGEVCVDIVLAATEFTTESNAESLQSDFANWKQSQPLTEASKKQVSEERAAAERNAHPRLTDVMRSIMAYPVEQHSPMECMAFLAEVKRQIAEFI